MASADHAHEDMGHLGLFAELFVEDGGKVVSFCLLGIGEEGAIYSEGNVVGGLLGLEPDNRCLSGSLVLLGRLFVFIFGFAVIVLAFVGAG